MFLIKKIFLRPLVYLELVQFPPLFRSQSTITNTLIYLFPSIVIDIFNLYLPIILFNVDLKRSLYSLKSCWQKERLIWDFSIQDQMERISFIPEYLGAIVTSQLCAVIDKTI